MAISLVEKWCSTFGVPWDAFGVPGAAYQWEACSVGTLVLPAQGMTFSQCQALFSTPKYRRFQGFIFSKTS